MYSRDCHVHSSLVRNKARSLVLGTRSQMTDFKERADLEADSDVASHLREEVEFYCWDRLCFNVT